MTTYFARILCCTAMVVSVWAARAGAEEMRTSGETARTVAESPKPQSTQIDRLIAQLGSARYIERRAAEQELLEIGLVAFDQVLAGTKSLDPEVASSCEYLLGKMTVRWDRRDDSPMVKQWLAMYGNYPDDSRQQFVSGLSRLPQGQGTGALCRICRYDRSEKISQLAALALLQPQSLTPTLPPNAAEIIAAEIGDSPRQGAKWLRLFAQQLRDEASALPAWRAAVEQALEEAPARESDSGEDFSEAQRDNLLWNVLRLELAADKQQPIEKTTAQLVGLRPDSANQTLTRVVAWITEAKNWPALERVLNKFEPQILATKQGAYAIAMARRVQGRDDLANQMAETAFKQPPDAQRRPDRLDARVRMGQLLLAKGLIEWGRRELNAVVDDQPVLSEAGIAARCCLYESLTDFEEYAAASALMDALNSKINESALNRRQFQNLLQQTNHPEVEWAKESRNREAYARACAARQKGERAEEIKQLEAAIAADPTDADAIIALYRIPDATPERREKTLKIIADLSHAFHQNIEEDPDRARYYNQWAWLVSNTVGDYEKAIRYSERSLELQPEEPGYLDTLARCYFAAGNVEKAVETQRKAVDLMPHMQVMQRQLQEFEQALASQSRQQAESSGQ